MMPSCAGQVTAVAEQMICIFSKARCRAFGNNLLAAGKMLNRLCQLSRKASPTRAHFRFML